MAQKASFQFLESLVRKSVFMRTPSDYNRDEEKNVFDIKPYGVLDIEEKQFQLTLSVTLTDLEERIYIEVDMMGLFQYEGDEEEIKPFIYMNASAILFPYVRAYITTLTANSGLSTVILPTMNLSSLKDELEFNTHIKN